MQSVDSSRPARPAFAGEADRASSPRRGGSFFFLRRGSNARDSRLRLPLPEALRSSGEVRAVGTAASAATSFSLGSSDGDGFSSSPSESSEEGARGGALGEVSRAARGSRRVRRFTEIRGVQFLPRSSARVSWGSSRESEVRSPRFSLSPHLLGPPRGNLPPTRSYAGVVFTTGVFLPAMVAAHLLAPHFVTLYVLLLPAFAILSQGIALPSGCGAGCLPSRRSLNAHCLRECFNTPAARVKASVLAGSLAPLLCIGAVSVKVPWLCHVSVLPLALSLLVLWPKVWCWLSCGLQLHLEIILCNAYIVTLPYSGSNSWFVCAVFCAAVSFFPISGYLALRMLALEPFSRIRGFSGSGNGNRFQKRVLAISALICFCWGAAVVALVVNIFFLHQPESPALRAVLRGELLPPDSDEELLSTQGLIQARLRRESIWLAGVSVLVAFCGVSSLYLTLRWDRWVRAEADMAQAAAGAESSRQSALLAQAVAAAVEAEQRARFEVLQENLKTERLTLESPEIGTICSICQDGLAENDKTSRMPTCGHVFHWECVSLWLRRKPTCPNCQLDVHREVLAHRAREEAAAAALLLATTHLSPPTEAPLQREALAGQDASRDQAAERPGGGQRAESRGRRLLSAAELQQRFSYSLWRGNAQDVVIQVGLDGEGDGGGWAPPQMDEERPAPAQPPAASRQPNATRGSSSPQEVV